jgi:hypothetical protein
MNRRDFFNRIAMFAGAMVLDPEELLWTPSKKIFIPPYAPIYDLLVFRMNRSVQLMADQF